MYETYLDNAATTPLDPDVRAAMEPWTGASFGNPSARCRRGVAAAEAVDRARRQVARVLGAPPEGLVFTSGGTEANNLGVIGAARAQRLAGQASAGHVLVGPTEHASVREAALSLVEEGFEVEFARLDKSGDLDLDDLTERLRPETVLVAQMLANNEFGTVYPVREVTRRVRARSPKAWIHVDAVQGLGKLELSLPAMGADSVALSAHKVHGPQGVGALALARSSGGGEARPKPLIRPLIWGGGQEHGLRSGTEDVAGLVGFGEAAARAESRRPEAARRMEGLRAALVAGIGEFSGATVLAAGGSLLPPLPSILAVTWKGVPAEVRLHHLEECGVVVSSGSACQATKDQISPALSALGLTKDPARRVLRFSFSHYTTMEDIERLLSALAEVEQQLESLVPAPEEAR
jgi:cysteine desulfurase